MMSDKEPAGEAEGEGGEEDGKWEWYREGGGIGTACKLTE